MDYEQQLVNEYRASAPTGAKHVVFIGDVDSASSRRYPARGGWDLWTGAAPPLPNGRYLLLYYDQNGNHLKTPAQRHIQISRTGPQPGSSIVNAHPPAAPGTSLTSGPSDRVPLLPEHQRELSAVEVSLRATEAEFKKHRMAVAMQRDGQKLARTARHTKELHEAATLNATYRLEMAALAETHSNITRRHVEHSAKMMENLGTVSEMVGTVITNLQKAAQTIGQPPPPPVDYSDTILKTVGMVGGMVLNGLALVKGLPPPAKGPAESADADFAGTVDAGLVDKNKPGQSPPANDVPARGAAQDPAHVPVPPASQSPPPDPAPMPARGPAPAAAAESSYLPAAIGTSSDAPRTADADLETEALAPDDRSELDTLLREFAQGAQDREQGLPVPETVEEDAGAAYFLTPDRSKEMDQLARFLQKLPNRSELEQIIAITAPHLVKEPE